MSLLWHLFLYDVNRATASLLYLLQGMEAVRASELAPYNALLPAQKTSAACFPKVSYVAVPLTLSGPCFDLNEMLGCEGEAEQLAFKGWVEQVYNCIWDSRYRNDRTPSGRRAIRSGTCVGFAMTSCIRARSPARTARASARF